MDEGWMAMPAPVVALLAALAIVLAALAVAWRRRGRGGGLGGARTGAGAQACGSDAAPRASVAATDAGIVATAPDGATQSVRWDALARVTIRTTDAGPWAEDVFWLLEDGAGQVRVRYAGGADGTQEALAAMQARLAGFDDAQVVAAMGSTGNAAFPVWERRATN